MKEVIFLLKNPEVILFGVILLVLFVLMISEFKLTSPRAWIILLGFTALGGLSLWQNWRRKLLLKELERREKALKDLEGRYQKLKEEARISQAAYEKAVAELEQVRKNAMLEILNADAEYRKQLREIRETYRDLSAEETSKKIQEILQGGQP